MKPKTVFVDGTVSVESITRPGEYFIPVLTVEKIHPNAVVPTRGTLESAGLDLTVVEDVTLWPNEVKLAKTGLKMKIPPNKVGVIFARSSIRKRGFEIQGVIDPDYRGEVFLSICNTGNEKAFISKGSRIAQMLILDANLNVYVKEGTVEVDTERGTGGIGSTGT